MSRVQRLTVVLVLNLALVAGLAVVGASAHSLGVLAEGGDYLLDAAGAGLALLAIGLSARRARGGGLGPTGAVALVNAGWLLLLELIVAGASIDRLATRTPAVHGLPVLVASGIAALVMTAGALVLRGDDDGDERDPSVAAVLLDTVADAAAAAGVAAAGAVILAVGGWYWLDPAVALTIAVLVAYHAVALIRTILRRRKLLPGDQCGDDVADLCGRQGPGGVAHG
jgi:cobalt-zinc-cadmium efflux system protein